MPALLKFQIGPVQDFIAQARSTRDLWSGSYLLSWLVASGIRRFHSQGGILVFPNPEGQPLLKLPSLPDGGHADLLTPNLPNIFVGRVESDETAAAGLAASIHEAITNEWQTIADAVWARRGHIGLPDSAEDRFFAQVQRHLAIAWQVTPIAGISADAYRQAFRLNGWHLDAVRQTRDFAAWQTGTGMTEKDSLSGKEEALIGGEDFRRQREKKGGEYGSLFAKHADYLGAVSIIKRCWHLAYLRDTDTTEKPALDTSSRKFPIRSIPAIAARTTEIDDEARTQEKAPGDKYIAAIAFDGDAIGAWVNGDRSPPGTDLAAHHQNFSLALSTFALGRVRAIVEARVPGKDANGKPCQVPLGQLIYAGGDDVVCLVPADAALQVAAELRSAFRDTTRSTPAKDQTPDASAGIAIGHIHAPLQDLIHEAQVAEKRAKNLVGRPAFSITLMKRSGEISQWGSQWESGGLALYQKLDALLDEGRLTSRFPHRVCQLLGPYLTLQADVQHKPDGQPETLSDAITDEKDARDLIAREFHHTAHRQGSAEVAKELAPLLQAYLDGIQKARLAREARSGKPGGQTLLQEWLAAVIGLCITLAFAHRNRGRDASDSAAATHPETAAA